MTLWVRKQLNLKAINASNATHHNHGQVAQCFCVGIANYRHMQVMKMGVPGCLKMIKTNSSQ